MPDSAPIDRLINFRTSGTTGHPLLLASHPVVAANYLAFHKRALRRFGIELRHGRGQVGVVLVGFPAQVFHLRFGHADDERIRSRQNKSASR